MVKNKLDNRDSTREGNKPKVDNNLGVAKESPVSKLHAARIRQVRDTSNQYWKPIDPKDPKAKK
jgi:hypothetical protein